MADVFISYAREDRLAAERIAAALGRHGWSVWWDANIPPGKTWDELIERELASASCAVVLWSATSLAKGWVKAEAAEALARGVLVPALIENVTPPLAFRHVQAAPLTDWRNDAEHAGFQQLLCSICALAGLPSRPEPADAGRALRPGRAKSRAAATTVSAGSGRSRATLCTTAIPPAVGPSDRWRPPATSEPRQAPARRTAGAPPASGKRLVRRALASGAIALAAATFGYGLNDALEWWLAPPALLAGDQASPQPATAPACTDAAATSSTAALQ